jgi:opacity protein-like surface antigen
MRAGKKCAIFISTMLISSGAAFAEHANHMKDHDYKDYKDYCPPPPALHDGFYVGLQGGYDSYRVRQKINLSGGVNSNPVLNASGVVGGLFLGYGQPIIRDRIYLGGELLANSSNASSTYTSTLGSPIGAYTAKYVVNSSYGAAFLPGVYLTKTKETLGYIRFGYSYAKMKYTESFAGTSTSKSKTSSGLNLGLGLETLIHEKFSGRLEYTHVFYNSFSTSNGTVVNPSDNQVMVALLYHFS